MRTSPGSNCESKSKSDDMKTCQPVCLSMSTSVSSVGAPSRSFSVKRLPQAFSSLEVMWAPALRVNPPPRHSVPHGVSSPAEGGVQAGPQVGVLGERCEWSGRVAAPLVWEDGWGEDAVHPDGPLWAHALFTVKHLGGDAWNIRYTRRPWVNDWFESNTQIHTRLSH